MQCKEQLSTVHKENIVASQHAYNAQLDQMDDAEDDILLTAWELQTDLF